MKLPKKDKHSSRKEHETTKNVDHLNHQEKNNHNKPLHTGNLIEKKWFPNERK